MPGRDADALTASATARTLRLLLAGGVATVVIGFVVGYVLAGGRGPDANQLDTAAVATTSTTAAPTTSTTGSVAPTSTTAAVSSTSASTTAAPASTTTVPTVPTTVATVAPSVPVTTAPPVTAPAPAPSRVLVSFGADATGRMILPRGGSATLVVANDGGLAQQWLVSGSGFSVAGPNQGTLAPGQSVAVTIVAPATELPASEVNGTISVLGAVNPVVPFVIPRA